MSGTVLEHPLVRDYLGELEAATRGLPPVAAGELSEQIRAHLDEALRPDAGDEDVAAALSRLGSPADLAAEAGAASGGLARPPRVHRVRARLARARPRTRIAAGLTVILVVAGIVAGAQKADSYLSAGPLQFTGNADWWYSQDVRHQVIAHAGDTTQNTTNIRSGQRQGYVIQIRNPTAVTQTILGDASGPDTGYDSFGWPVQIAVSRSNADIANGVAGHEAAGSVGFALPATIPPFQTRLVRVLWTSDICLSKGEATSISQLVLRVRAGWFTRTEIIPQQYWYLLGPSHGRCV